MKDRGRSEPLLEIESLTVGYRTSLGMVDAVRGATLAIDRGETYGLVGESGSGKSTLAMAVMRYLHPAARIRAGAIRFAGRDLALLSGAQMRSVWGREMALVPQDAQSALNPSVRIGEQIAEPLRRHMGLGNRDAARRVIELLSKVRIAEPQRVARDYPYQLSGGMQQRVLIAMAVATEPQLLLLDEPTTALDVTTQATVLDLLADLVQERATAAVYVTHNLGVVAGVTQRVGVLYAGELVEEGPTAEVFRRPLHPYTRGLLDSVVRLGQRWESQPLEAIPGRMPAPGARPAACIYAPRCPLAIDRCHSERPVIEDSGAGRRVSCHRWREIDAGQVSPSLGAVPAVASPPRRQSGTLLAIGDLSVQYRTSRGMLELLKGETRRPAQAVKDVSVELGAGEILGIVGESGSGKSSLARAIIGLVPASGGTMTLLGLELPPRLGSRGRNLLRRLRIVFQNPQDALNPYLTVEQTLRRPLEILVGLDARAATERAAELLDAVELPRSYATRLPGQLSGGEKQRVAIARAIAGEPDLLVADEPVSALDVSVQASVLNLLGRLRIGTQGATIFIAHDIAVVAYLADRIAVMYRGEVVELSPAAQLLQRPSHPYTQALLSAVPSPDPDAPSSGLRLQVEATGVAPNPGGCPFHPRCRHSLGSLCAESPPPWQQVEAKGYRCHLAPAELALAQSDLSVAPGS